MKEQQKEVIIGIDLGTTYSCVAVWQGDNGHVIANKFGNRTTPSWVAYTDKERLVGEAAVNQAQSNTENTLYDSKRMIGRKFSDSFVQEDLKLWPFKVVENDKGMASYQVKFKGNTTIVSPEEVSAAILMKMKEIAEDYLGHSVEKAVVTVPAYFNDSMRQCTKDCAKIAGLEVVRMINEPTAAALAYGLDKISSDKPSNLLIFDFGGGTFDVTVLTVDHGTFEVLSTSGDTHLGGQDFDNALVEYFASDFQEKHGEDLRDNAKAIRKLKVKSQLVKHALSQSLEAQIEIDGLYNGIDYSCQITRAQFNDLCEELYERMLIPVQNALKDAGLEKTEIDEIVLIGGSTRIVEVQDRLQEFFNGKQLCKKINPDEAVALGASIQAANLSLSSEEKKGSKLEKVILMDVTPMSLGIELANGKMSVIIPRNTNIPYQHARTYYNNEDNQSEATVVVYEGEEEYTSKNRLLGTFVLQNIPKRPRGRVQIEVMFVIDTNGILDVTATVKDDRNITTTLKIDQNKGLLTQDQIEEMAEEAHKIKEEQALIEKLKKAKNDLLQFVAKVKKEMRKFTLSTENKNLLEKLFQETQQWLSNPNAVISADQVEAQQQFLEKEWGKIRDNIDLFN